ncbi:MAG: hypothetical protein AUJ08_02350 [Thaumarchaeota archaeon 13_1_40CM_3_50_5]|nr:MAG: hypothetical protein AUH71_04790 [Thaumarchaeota archaeon 13_1_40CM_4_48_7]OLC85870.1 MAG: hypothetical protein AUJ08_02350 [Thaumarchaeota archaeon 13_1_40CM_3_50_5]
MLKSSNILPPGTGVTVEKLDRIYSCAECKAVFFFKLDASDHEKESGHTKLREMPLEGWR